MTSSVYRLSFMVGPVQGFVAQARRTKDFWSGSWLLSYLTEVALISAEQNSLEVLIPYRGNSKGILTSLGSTVGGIPNRFEMRFENEAQAKQAAQAAQNALRDEWLAIANIVWDTFVKPVEGLGNASEEIWNGQVENFWELSWVITQERDPSQLVGRALQARKAFRNVPVQDSEPGTKCSLMSDYQEISGHVGVGNSAGKTNRDKFWKSLSKKLKKLPRTTGLDLGDAERLCAMALIKRLLPNFIKSLPANPNLTKCLPPNPSADLELQSHWPSLGFFAALPWLKNFRPDKLDEAKKYIQMANQENKEENDDDKKNGQFWLSEREPSQRFGVDWATIDATAWFKTGVRNNEPGMTKDKQEKMLDLLSAFYQQHQEKGPMPYYALLFMDGDSMGKLLEELRKAKGDRASTELSRMLSVFSGQVEKIVGQRQGRVVYAGGDDVLAFLAAEQALEAASVLAQAYRSAFPGINNATLSGTIIYAHWRFPLNQVIRLSHRLLDDVAKDATGRNSLCLAIVQGSGLNAVWSAPWDVVWGTNSKHKIVPFAEMIERFAPVDHTEEQFEDGRPKLNSSYLYLLRDQFARLFRRPVNSPGSFQELDGEFAKSLPLLELAHSEFRRRMTKERRVKMPRTETLPHVENLLQLSQKWVRDKDHNTQVDANKFAFDGWRIARFLRQVKEGKLPDHE